MFPFPKGLAELGRGGVHREDSFSVIGCIERLREHVTPFALCDQPKEAAVIAGDLSSHAVKGLTGSNHWRFIQVEAREESFDVC